MSYLKEITWQLVPLNSPKVNRTCPKCGNHASFINTEKFRVNANKNKLDIWLIYQCEKCKSTWNMTIYERTSPKDIPENIYKRFLENDKELAFVYGFDKSIHVKNRVSLDYESVDYSVVGEEINLLSDPHADHVSVALKISCDKAFDLRLDKLLSQQLDISRSQVKRLYKEEMIWSTTSKNILKEKIQDELIVGIKIQRDCMMSG